MNFGLTNIFKFIYRVKVSVANWFVNLFVKTGA